MTFKDLRRIIFTPANGFALGIVALMYVAAHWIFNAAMCYKLEAVGLFLESFQATVKPGAGLLTWAFILIGVFCLGIISIIYIGTCLYREARVGIRAAGQGNWTAVAALITALVVALSMIPLWNLIHDELWLCFGLGETDMDAVFYKGGWKKGLEYLAVLFVLLWLTRVSYLSGRLRRLNEGNAHLRARIAEYTGIHRELHVLLLLAGWFILLTTVNTAIERSIIQDAMRAARIASGKLEAAAAAKTIFIPFDMVTFLGLMNIALVIAFIGPAYHQLHATGGELVDAAFGGSPASEGDWSDWASDRKAMQDYLGLTKGLRELLTAGLPALAPLIGAILSQFLKF